MVPPTLASDSHSIAEEPPLSLWPVTTVKAGETLRCVTGIPAAAGTPIAEVIPGTTVNGIRAS